MVFGGISDFLRSHDTGGTPLNPPLTQTASSHAITIKTASGIKIGRIQNWNVQLTRVVDTIFEVQQQATGEPLERIPQIQSTNSISVERYELYSLHMGQAFGTPTFKALKNNTHGDLYNLTQQAKPFHIRELWGDPFGNIRAYVYVGCWFSNLGITIAANDDRIIKARATLEFTRRLRLL